MAKENKPGGDLNNIRSQTDDLLRSLDSVDTASKSSPKPLSTGRTSASSPAKPPAQKSSSSSTKTILLAAGSLAGIAVVIIGGLVALEASKQATLSREAELAKQQAIRDRAALAKEKAEREKAAREEAERERAAREQEEFERLANLREQLKSKGWREAGSSGLLFRYCNPGSNDSKLGLGANCSEPKNNRYRWFGAEFYCLSTNCSGEIEGTFGSAGNSWVAQERVSLGYISFKPMQRRVFTFKQTRDRGAASSWMSKAGGFCGDSEWEKC